MTSAKPLKFTPPWALNPAWQEANGSLDFHVDRYRADLQPAVATARNLRRLLASIFPLLNDICMATCPWCPEPCCLTASPWYDFRDLVFLHLNLLEPPPAQTIHAYRETCRYSSPQGCTLSRITRPWICTWYICPVQKAYLKKRSRSRWNAFDRTVCEIKQGRKALEAEFIRVIS
jgi:hypothetical protein